MELKKTYKGFIIWIIVFCLALFSLSFLPTENGALVGRLINILTTLAITVLMLIVYKTGYIYWINGVEYTQAVEAGSERRKIYARKHLKRFGLFSAGFLVFTVLAWSFDISYWIDLVVLCIGLVATAISTIKFKV